MAELSQTEWAKMVGCFSECCPGCGSKNLSYSCHFSYGSWRCRGCGATIDSRVAAPACVTEEERAERWPELVAHERELAEAHDRRRVEDVT